MTPKPTHVFLFAVLVSISSCFGDTKDILPQFKTDEKQLFKEIETEISFKETSIRTSKNETTGERTSRNIDIILTNAEIKSYSEVRLDSLSRRIGSVTKKNINNISVYDWLNVIYLTDDGSPISDSTDHKTYVYRPFEIK